MPAAGGELSEAVRAAQERLGELRREHGAAARGRAMREAAESAPAPFLPFSPAPLLPRPPAPPLTYHSRHTSEPLIAHLRAAAARRAQWAAADDRQWLSQLRITNDELRIEKGEAARGEWQVAGEGGAISPAPLLPCSLSPLHPPPSCPPAHVRVHPDIALAILRRKKAAPGRVWLLLRQADAAGRGRVAVAEAVRLLSGGASPWRICGRRQVANLLAAGDGLFWQRDRGRDGAEYLRLHSAARVAAALGVARLGGSPVAVPVAELTGTIGRARAHLYAAFHSGRTSHDLLSGERRARGPIARETLCKLSGASRNSQRNYERVAVVGRRSAVALGPRLSAADEHEFAWQHGRALFHYHDRKGRYGCPGAVYLAWQLPNEYTGPHAMLPRGGQKRLNRAIADLFHDGMTGNGDGRPLTADRRPREEKRKGAEAQREESSPAPLPPCSLSPLLPFSPTLRRSFYNSAKAAFLARGGHERYWRQGGVWLWQPEVTSVDRRVMSGEDRRPPTAERGRPGDDTTRYSPLAQYS